MGISPDELPMAIKSANDYDWQSKEATDYLDSLTDKQLQKRLLLVREQLTKAVEQNKDAVAEGISRHEWAIIEARMRKL